MSDNPMQDLADALDGVMRRTRQDYHLLLGQLIETLKEAHPGDTVHFDDGIGGNPGQPCSYRGYYADLAFIPVRDEVQAGAFLKVCQDALNSWFEAWKGGKYLMAEEAPLWASYEDHASGTAIIGVRRDSDRIILVTKQTQAF